MHAYVHVCLCVSTVIEGKHRRILESHLVKHVAQAPHVAAAKESSVLVLLFALRVKRGFSLRLFQILHPSPAMSIYKEAWAKRDPKNSPPISGSLPTGMARTVSPVQISL